MFKKAIWILTMLPYAAHAGYLTYSTSSGIVVNDSNGYIEVRNGVIQPGGTITGPAITNGGGTATTSFSQSITGLYQAGSSANLGTGELKASSMFNGVSGYVNGGANSRARFSDDLTFTNSTNATQYMSITQTIRGTILSKDETFRGSQVFAQVNFSVLSAVGSILFRNAGGAGVFGSAGGSTDMIYNVLNEGTPYFTSTAGNQQGGFSGPGSNNIFDTISDGGYNAIVTTMLGFTPGVTRLRILGELYVDCRGSTSCDYGNTSVTSFGALPQGLTYGSDSGVFLAETGNTAGVPEPGTWMLAAAGLGFVLRRRK